MQYFTIIIFYRLTIDIKQQAKNQSKNVGKSLLYNFHSIAIALSSSCSQFFNRYTPGDEAILHSNAIMA